MAFWTSSEAEPKRKFRFKVSIFTNTDGIAWYTKSISAPSFEVSSIEHHFSDHVFHYPGKIKWNDISVTLIDPAGDNDVVNSTLAMIDAAGYQIPGDPSSDGAFDSFSKAELTGNNGNVILEALDQSGNALERWELHNAFITAAKFGDFDYASEDMREIELTFKYDWASCTLGSGNGNKTYFSTGG
tara:strand:+ start:1854 stop:2411 length:558 start_codon:yes stop_codon:yes gene_type:complete